MTHKNQRQDRPPGGPVPGRTFHSSSRPSPLMDTAWQIKIAHGKTHRENEYLMLLDHTRPTLHSQGADLFASGIKSAANLKHNQLRVIARWVAFNYLTLIRVEAPWRLVEDCFASTWTQLLPRIEWRSTAAGHGACKCIQRECSKGRQSLAG